MSDRPLLRVGMYTHGMGSGHLMRINAVYRGFRRARIGVNFRAYAPRSKYLHLLDPGIRRDEHMFEESVHPAGFDVIICDWAFRGPIEAARERMARVWVGLRRLGRIAGDLPPHFHVIGIEPTVPADVVIWPIIATWPDQLLTRPRVRDILNIQDDAPIRLLVENGAYARHLEAVFSAEEAHEGIHSLRCSNSPHARFGVDLGYHPVAELFAGVDEVVLGAGYNSVHEALSYCDLTTVEFVHVGGDDQAARLERMGDWQKGRGSKADELALYIRDILPAIA